MYPKVCPNCIELVTTPVCPKCGVTPETVDADGIQSLSNDYGELNDHLAELNRKFEYCQGYPMAYNDPLVIDYDRTEKEIKRIKAILFFK